MSIACVLVLCTHPESSEIYLFHTLHLRKPKGIFQQEEKHTEQPLLLANSQICSADSILLSLRKREAEYQSCHLSPKHLMSDNFSLGKETPVFVKSFLHGLDKFQRKLEVRAHRRPALGPLSTIGFQRTTTCHFCFMFHDSVADSVLLGPRVLLVWVWGSNEVLSLLCCPD